VVSVVDELVLLEVFSQQAAGCWLLAAGVWIWWGVGENLAVIVLYEIRLDGRGEWFAYMCGVWRVVWGRSLGLDRLRI
jgi:hypothetical protein